MSCGNRAEVQSVGLPPFPIEFEKHRYIDPSYFAMCRYQAASLLNLMASRYPDQIPSVRSWIQRMGVNGQGILLKEEVQEIYDHQLKFPLPWSLDDCKRQVPRKYEGVNNLFCQMIPDMAGQLDEGQRIIVGLTSGVFDVLHAGHLRFLQECRKHCHVLVVGVDENQLVKSVKGEKRPVNDFTVRVGTLSEVPEIDFLFRVSEFFTKTSFTQDSFYGAPYTLMYYGQAPSVLDQLQRRVQLGELYPDWYTTCAPYMRVFTTQNDPYSQVKEANAQVREMMNVILPELTSLSSSFLIKHFGIQQSPEMPNAFGPTPRWSQT